MKAAVGYGRRRPSINIRAIRYPRFLGFRRRAKRSPCLPLQSKTVIPTTGSSNQFAALTAETPATAANGNANHNGNLSIATKNPVRTPDSSIITSFAMSILFIVVPHSDTFYTTPDEDE